MANDPFEIPQTLRNLSEQNLRQAHEAYEQLAGFVTKAMDTLMGAMPANSMTDSFKDVQGRAMEIAMENAESAFAFAGKICNAPTPQDIATLQTQFAQERAQAFITQTQQLFSFMGGALPKSERAAMDISMGAMPTNLIPSNLMTGFQDVQDRAVAMAKKNAESASALVEEIGKAQNVQDVFGLQSRFALEQMKAYTEQTQELQKLIVETLQKLQHG